MDYKFKKSLQVQPSFIKLDFKSPYNKVYIETIALNTNDPASQKLVGGIALHIVEQV